MISKPKGTKDIYGIDAGRWLYVNNVIEGLMEKYNYEFIRTPIFEGSEVFHRTVGASSDIVSKETYDFIDRGERNMTLRPEGTAGVVRSYIENKMYGDGIQPKKLYYNGTMYRYDRPQAGRYRELTQFGVEVLGSDDPYIDAEVISIPINLYKILGLKNIKVNLNTLGDNISRDNYRKALKEYLKPKLNKLCPDCQDRFEKNPLRILDCKYDNENQSDIINNAPNTIDYLTDEAKKRFQQVQDYLDVLDIEYEINPKIIRGLDYYSHVVFEVSSEIDGYGAQNVLCGGGRYDGLCELLDGPQTFGVGFAMGIDRLMLALEKEDITIPIKSDLDCYVMAVNDKEKEYAAYLTQDLRLNGFKTEIENMNRTLKAQFKQADRFNAKFLIILNSNDLKNGEINVKDNITKEEKKIKKNDIIEYLDMNI